MVRIFCAPEDSALGNKTLPGVPSTPDTGVKQVVLRTGCWLKCNTELVSPGCPLNRSCLNLGLKECQTQKRDEIEASQKTESELPIYPQFDLMELPEPVTFLTLL